MYLLQKHQNINYVQYLIVTYVSYIHRIIRIIICTYMDRCNEMLHVFLLLLNYFYLLILQRIMYTCIRDRINYQEKTNRIEVKITIHTYIERLTKCIITTSGSCDSDLSVLTGVTDPHFTVLNY